MLCLCLRYLNYNMGCTILLRTDPLIPGRLHTYLMILRLHRAAAETCPASLPRTCCAALRNDGDISHQKECRAARDIKVLLTNEAMGRGKQIACGDGTRENGENGKLCACFPRGLSALSIRECEISTARKGMEKGRDRQRQRHIGGRSSSRQPPGGQGQALRCGARPNRHPPSGSVRRAPAAGLPVDRCPTQQRPAALPAPASPPPPQWQ